MWILWHIRDLADFYPVENLLFGEPLQCLWSNQWSKLEEDLNDGHFRRG